MSSTVFIICCLQSVTLSWLADYGRLQFIEHFVRGQIDSKIRFYLIASLTTSDSRNIVFYCLLCVCVYVCIVHTDVTTIAQVLVLVLVLKSWSLSWSLREVLVLVLVLGTQVLVLVLVLGLGKKSLLTSLLLHYITFFLTWPKSKRSKVKEIIVLIKARSFLDELNLEQLTS